MDELGETTAQLAQALEPAYSEYDDDEYGDDADLSDDEYADLEAELGDELDEIDAEALDGDEGDGIERLAEALQSALPPPRGHPQRLRGSRGRLRGAAREAPGARDEQTARRIVGRAAISR